MCCWPLFRLILSNVFEVSKQGRSQFTLTFIVLKTFAVLKFIEQSGDMVTS